MARKKTSRPLNNQRPQASQGLKKADVAAFESAFARKDYSLALEIAQILVQRSPDFPKAYELKANALGRLERFAEAADAMQSMLNAQMSPPDSHQRLKMAQYLVFAGQAEAAVVHLEDVVELQPDSVVPKVWLSRALFQLGEKKRALEINDTALEISAKDEEALIWRARILEGLKRHDETLEVLEELHEISPLKKGVHNHMATLFVKESSYDKAEYHYKKELDVDPDNSKVMANLFTASHYNPKYTPQELFDQARQWGSTFSPQRVQPADTVRKYDKKLRVAFLSGGFRMHPVGQMTLSAIQEMPKDQFELIFYSTNQVADFLTDEFRTLADRWEVVEGLSDEWLERKIRDDSIDILIDLNGAGDGSRYEVLVHKPVPLIVKWVGSLINTTGLGCFDYLLSDAVETPEDVDEYYTESLIRLPDDYICYHYPRHAPTNNALPALSNGYVTFGCLNNPAKLSPPMLAEWAVLLKEVPGSKLLLRGVQFESKRFCRKIVATFAEHGISEDRLLLEGPADHKQFLETYHRIDIALDTWPYSGGLTTCESLLMGVPVVTRTGPTFAGRHSATHLVNAGLPELVTDSWDDFRARVKELADDLPNLAVIRAALRTILLDSPICDGPRFAGHLTTALRAIWQRHCEGKAPEALSFRKSGAAQFADEDAPIKLALAAPGQGFDWQLESPVLAVDNGAVLASRPDARDLLGSGRVVMLSFDPAGKMATVDHLAQYGEIQHFPHTALGDGQPATLHLGEGLEPSTLPPLDDIEGLEKHEIPTVALDSIEGLPKIDVLALDAMHDSMQILENARNALSNTLLLQVRMAFQTALRGQADFAKINAWMERNGFRFYTFINCQHRSYYPEGVLPESGEGSELDSTDAIYIPNAERLESVGAQDKRKLAYIFSDMLEYDDFAYSLLSAGSNDAGKEFLATKSVALNTQDDTASDAGKVSDEGDFELDIFLGEELVEKASRKEKVVHICFNNLHVQALIDVLGDDRIVSEYEQEIWIGRARSMPGYDVDISMNKNAFYFDQSGDLEKVMKRCLAEDVCGVFFHGLFFDWQKALVRQVGKLKKSIWVMWGGDLYNPIKSECLLREEVECLSGVTTWWDGDYEIFKKYYGDLERIPFRYYGGKNYAGIKPPERKEKMIFVGNSGDPSNNHVEILEALARKEDILEYKIIVPFGYSAPDGYKDLVYKAAKRLGLSRVINIVDRMLDSFEYFTWLSRAEFTVMAHHRQQGGANINASIIYGNKVVMRRSIAGVGEERRINPVWQDVKSHVGAEVFDFDNFCVADSLNCIEFEDLNAQKLSVERMKKRLSKESVVDEILSGFESL
ncbi:TDP-N-acetylfucosamine:lipid II N-acetylfucosaminyltransferase [Halomonas sp. SL1]|uniref:TDP-N-acetylfucosamine:lipid II N-acetylfucosaminyltransferase n=1 Tax=Halomonas sp. SL1 TaxID=2137478 RepID=UPI000D174FD2|nr:TDP-N-acetylfucosamine:lipid II N-acetylfucosaminyltransferase [Halomonas sp. SL1]RAH36584.1 hypothetical protein C9J49_015480 [Halomonas sp. SL1]